MNDKSQIEQIIFRLFHDRWVGDAVTKDVSSMAKQLRRNLQNQVDGYWSGHTAYSIMIDGGFLINEKSGTKKKLTVLGEMFMGSTL